MSQSRRQSAVRQSIQVVIVNSQFKSSTVNSSRHRHSFIILRDPLPRSITHKSIEGTGRELCVPPKKK
jgi:hypothetical protein